MFTNLSFTGVEGSPSVAQLGAVTVEVTQNTQPVHRKNSRRNPWGNCSYSDLIEQVNMYVKLKIMLFYCFGKELETVYLKNVVIRP